MLATGEGPPELVAALCAGSTGIARERAAARLARGGVAVETPERSFRLEGGAVVSGTHPPLRPGARAGRGADAGRERGGRRRARRRRRRRCRSGCTSRPRPARWTCSPSGWRRWRCRRRRSRRARRPTRRPGSRARQPVGGALRALVGPRPGRVPGMVLRALRKARYDPANLGHAGLASPRLLPLHVADPAPPRPAGAPRAPAPPGRAPDAAAGAGRRWPPRRRTTPPPSARPRLLERTADDVCAAFLLERRAVRAGLGRDLHRRGRRGDRLRRVRPLRRAVRGLSARPVVGRRVRRPRSAGGRAGRPPQRAPAAPGRPVEVAVGAVDRTAGRVRIRASACVASAQSGRCQRGGGSEYGSRGGIVLAAVVAAGAASAVVLTGAARHVAGAAAPESDPARRCPRSSPPGTGRLPGMYAADHPADRARVPYTRFVAFYKDAAAVATMRGLHQAGAAAARRRRVGADVGGDAAVRTRGGDDVGAGRPDAVAAARRLDAALTFPGLEPGEHLAMHDGVPQGRGRSSTAAAPCSPRARRRPAPTRRARRLRSSPAT